MSNRWGRKREARPKVVTPGLGTRGSTKRAGRGHYAAGFLGVCVLSGSMMAGILMPVVGTGAVAANRLAKDFQALPSDLSTVPPAQASVILAEDGTRIASFYDENRVDVPLDHVAPLMKQAILAIEDYRFYQ